MMADYYLVMGGVKLYPIEPDGCLKMGILRGYILSRMMKLTEPYFMESCEIYCVPSCGKCLTVSVNDMDNWWQLGIIVQLSTH